MAAVQLRGVYVPLITPFDESGGVALDAVERLVQEYLDAGVAGIVALGTTGEASALDTAEKRAVIDACARVCSERDAHLIVGAGTNNTAATIAAVEALHGTPALAGALVVVPYYVRPSEAGIVAHFEAVADASPVPLVLYNIPQRTGRALSAAGVLRAAQHPNITGLKQAVGALDVDTLEILAGAAPGFGVLAGDDPFIYPAVLMGGAGAIAASAHVCTERFVAMVECGLAGKLDDGRGHAEALLPVVEACFAEPNPVVFKAVLHAQGRIPTPDVRLPLLPASDAARERALAAITAATSA
ncbi:MAG: 4-hydroxy-tetrahydrodipicolinate synthase [Actinobacteria bacterium]|nr:4-hydroxy-tetrahydrodipicolinate synthase [Actinomycetota bacterium]